jgi:drug/metabolite transporter (DMT)-like permease
MCIAFSGIFYRFAAAPAESAAFFRCLYGLPILIALGWVEHRRHGELPRNTVIVSVVAGLFFAADLGFWHHSIEFVGAGLATVIANLQVIVVGVVAWLLFRERPSRSTLVAVPIVLAGVVLISGVVGSNAYGTNPALGVILGVLTAFAYGGYLLAIRRGGLDGGRAAGPLAISTASTAVASFVVGALLGEVQLTPSWPAHGWLIVYGLTAQSLGYLLISISLPRLPAVLTSIILLSQPVATVALSMVLLGEAPSIAQLLGVALVIGGIAVATVPVRRLARDVQRVATSRAMSR